MLKHYCNRKECGKEIDTKTFFAELIVTELSPFILKAAKIGDPTLEQRSEKKFHFCKECWKLLSQDLNI